MYFFKHVEEINDGDLASNYRYVLTL